MRPSLWLLGALLVWVLLGVAAAIWPAATALWLYGGGALALLSVLDILFLALARPVVIERNLPGKFALGSEAEVELTVRNRGWFRLWLRVFDGLPVAAETQEMPWSGVVPGRGFVRISYSVRMLERGLWRFEPAYLLRGSFLRLWLLHGRAGPSQECRVYPNFEPTVRYALLALAHQESQMGIQLKNLRGVSREFLQLRDYQEGDALSQIDWKATSRRLSLISREYREQRDQNVVVLVDSGRRMRAMDGELAQFDHCLNAVLLVAFIALRQGDHVGILGFGGTDRFLPPVKGTHAMPTLLNHLYDYRTTALPSDYSSAAEQLMVRQRRRSLVLIVTNLRSEDAGDLIPAIRILQRRHLVILASLREQSVDGILRRPVQHLEDALLYGASVRYLEERRGLLETLRARGVVTVDAVAATLPVALSNAYLQVKRSGKL